MTNLGAIDIFSILHGTMKKDTVSCPRCDFDNPADTYFCGKCGTNLGVKETPQISKTITLMTPVPELQRGKMFTGRPGRWTPPR